jgi:DNA topoisomerase-1
LVHRIDKIDDPMVFKNESKHVFHNYCPMKLLIIESPGKQATIKKYLGSNWMVLASLGHIRGLEHNLDFLQRDFEPKYEWITEKARAIKQLKEAAKEAEEIYLAADKDFEGEQIAYSVCLLLKLNPATAKRITFTEITQKAILAAIEQPGRIDMNRVHTQQCRALLDLLIGFTMSPLLWKYVAPSLSAGRCQTPAVRLVVERENVIQDFTAESSWRISGQWTHSQSGHEFQATMTDELRDEESASNYMENIHTTSTAIVDQKTIRPTTEHAPEPLITSTLQQQASALYHSNPKNTMRIAQRLYEAGHITYMRTDKATLSEEATVAAKQWVADTYGAEYVTQQDLSQAKKKKGKKEDEVKAQEAHEAIRPTHMEYTELDGADWQPLDKKIYRLIWQRTIQSVMAPVRGESCTLTFHIEGDEDFSWATHEKHTLFEGWRRVGAVASIEDNDEEEKEDSEARWTQLTTIEPGDMLTWSSIRADSVETKAKGRYNEATLVKDLETYGIGRPSTFASLLAVIQEKGYVETKDIPSKEVEVKEYVLHPHQWPPIIATKKKKMGGEKNKLVPTELGRSMLQFMLHHFEDLFAYGFTARMEKRLDAIADGQEEWKQVMRDMWQSYKDRYDALSSSHTSSSIKGGKEPSERRREWRDGLVAVMTKKGPLLLIEGDTKEQTIFLGWPKGISFQDLTEEQAVAFRSQAQKEREGETQGTWKGQLIIKKSGKFGTYLQCGEYTIPYLEGEDEEKTVERLEAKQSGQGQGVLKSFKEYVVRQGPYGPYIIKTSLKKTQFVSLPKEVKIETVTEKEIETWYKLGLDTKKNWKKLDKSRVAK